MLKYRNRRTVIGDQRYRSQREAARHQELLLLQRAGHVCDIRREVAFVLAPRVRFTGQRQTPPLRYVADFTYTENGRQVVEDAKGVRTQVYKIKRHLMLAVHGIEVRET